jgi:hypothetical protein
VRPYTSANHTAGHPPHCKPYQEPRRERPKRGERATALGQTSRPTVPQDTAIPVFEARINVCYKPVSIDPAPVRDLLWPQPTHRTSQRQGPARGAAQ